MTTVIDPSQLIAFAAALGPGVSDGTKLDAVLTLLLMEQGWLPSSLPPPPPPPPSGSALIVAEGDSITADTRSYAHLYANDTPGVMVIDTAVLGSKLADVVARRASDIGLIAQYPGKSRYIYTLLIGANDMPPGDPTAYVNAIAAHCDALKAGGFTFVVVLTMIEGGLGEFAYEAYRSKINAGIRGLVPTHADAVVDLDTTIMGWPGSDFLITYFSDQVHPAPGGHAIIKAPYASIVNSLASGVIPPPMLALQPPIKPTPLPDTFDNLTASPGPQLVFSNNNCTISVNPGLGAGGMARTMIGKSTGKWFAEFRIDGTAPGHQFFGVSDDALYQIGFPITGAVYGPNDLGTGPNSTGYSGYGTYGNNNGFTEQSSPGFTAPVQGDRVQILFNCDIKRLWIGLNNSYGYANDPATGSGGWAWTSNLKIFPVVQLKLPTDTVTYMRDSLLRPPPPGFLLLGA